MTDEELLLEMLADFVPYRRARMWAESDYVNWNAHTRGTIERERALLWTVIQLHCERGGVG